MSRKKNHPSSRKEMEAQIIAHAWKDATFKKLLLSDPKEALKQINCPCPESFDIKVIEERENTLTLVLPTPPSSAPSLSEQELASLAGGDKTGYFCIPFTNPAECEVESTRK